jgi:hypothetical protein
MQTKPDRCLKCGGNWLDYNVYRDRWVCQSLGCGWRQEEGPDSRNIYRNAKPEDILIRTKEQEDRFGAYVALGEDCKHYEEGPLESLKGFAKFFREQQEAGKKRPFKVKGPVYDFPWDGKQLDLGVIRYPISTEEKDAIFFHLLTRGIVGQIKGKWLYFPPTFHGPLPVTETEAQDYAKLPDCWSDYMDVI